MKKNRSSFFNENIDYNQYNNYNQSIPNQNMMFPGAMTPPTFNAQSSFYAGPSQMSNQMPSQMPAQMPAQMNIMPNSSVDDVDSRLAKMERQINRLEHRVNRLEQNNTISSENFESNINDMYMV